MEIAAQILISTVGCLMVMSGRSVGQPNRERMDASRGTQVDDVDRLQPYAKNPYYWQHPGRPILLLCASDYHSIFQRPEPIELVLAR